MGTGVAMKRFPAVLCLLLVAACGANSSDDPFLNAISQIRTGLFNRAESGGTGFTATRASLQEAGITQPVLVARLPRHDISVGLLEHQTNRGVTVWRSLDGSTLSTAGGLLRNTRGFGQDLHSLETDPLAAALGSGDDAEYSRLFRALDGDGALLRARLYCRLIPVGQERIDVLGRAYDTWRFQETCEADGLDTPVFQNDYWLGAGGEIWRSRQWAGAELGYAELERVIN